MSGQQQHLFFTSDSAVFFYVIRSLLKLTFFKNFKKIFSNWLIKRKKIATFHSEFSVNELFVDKNCI